MYHLAIKKFLVQHKIIGFAQRKFFRRISNQRKFFRLGFYLSILKRTFIKNKFSKISFPTWTPLSESDLIYFFESEIGTYLDGLNRCSQWNDQSIGLNHVAQSDITKQLILTPNQQNGYPALIGDGVNDWMFRNGITQGNLTQPNIIFLIAKGDVLTNEYRIPIDGLTDTLNNGLFLGGIVPPLNTFSFFAGIESRSNIVNDKINYHLWIGVFNSPNSKLYIDNQTPFITDCGNFAYNGIYLGRWRNGEQISGQDCCWKGGFLSLGMFHKSPTIELIDNIKMWAKNKYQLPFL